MAKKPLYKLTPEHRAQLGPWRDRWIANAMSTTAMTDEDRAACREAALGLYAAAGLPPPKHVVFVPSPFVLAFAGGFAASIWHRRASAATWAATAAAREATREATRAATEATTRAAEAGAAAREATGAVTWAATRAAEAATWAVTWAAEAGAVTWAATGAVTWAATEAAREATEAAQEATWAATAAAREATEAATWAATAAAREATWAAQEATWAATAAAREATEAATWAATAAAREATWAATAAAREATEAAREATGAVTWAATRAAEAAEAAARTKTWYVVPDMRPVAEAIGVGEFGLRCASETHRMWQGGNQWCAYDSYLSFFQDVARLDLPEYAKYQHWRTLAERSGPRIVHPDFCMISDRPELLMVDERNRPHNDTGPFCRWRDGTALYAVHGVRIPAWIVEHPEDITIAAIDGERNSEVQRVMIERFGWDRYARESGATLIDHDERWGSLFRRGDVLFLRVVNRSPEPDGSFRNYVLPVAPGCEPIPDPADPNGALGEPQTLTALNAVASTFGMTGRDYAKVVKAES